MNIHSKSAGQTVIILLIFMMLAITLTVAATAIIIINTQGNVAYENGSQALQNAQTGIENALVKLERDNTYAGETMTLANGTATITVSGTAPYAIVSKGTSGSDVRTITATATITGGALTLTSWSETP